MERTLALPEKECDNTSNSKQIKNSDSSLVQEYTYTTSKELTEEEKLLLEKQNSRLVSEFKSMKIESESKKHWDLFYKRNGTKFFKDRHWTTREFVELIDEGSDKVMLEIGCGVGNLIFPLVNESTFLNWYFFACDISPRAVEIVKNHELFDSKRMNVFQTDVTLPNSLNHLNIDICTLVFVLSAIHPSKFLSVLTNVYNCLKPGGLLLLRDYGLYDMAQLRFKAGNKISENLYLRQDGTRSYFFSVEEIDELSTSVGFQVVHNCYVHRRTVNVKESIDVPRIFVQSKLLKPS